MLTTRRGHLLVPLPGVCPERMAGALRCARLFYGEQWCFIDRVKGVLTLTA